MVLPPPVTRNTNRQSLKCLFLQVSIENPGPVNTPAWGTGPLDFIVMENVFYGHDVDVIYDLKGSFRDRYAAPLHQYGPPVLLDENLRERNLLTPTIISARSFQYLEACLQNDTGNFSVVSVIIFRKEIRMEETL